MAMPIGFRSIHAPGAVVHIASHADPSAADIARLKAARETNDELLHAFEAAHRLIERGYTDIG